MLADTCEGRDAGKRGCFPVPRQTGERAGAMIRSVVKSTELDFAFYVVSFRLILGDFERLTVLSSNGGGSCLTKSEWQVPEIGR